VFAYIIVVHPVNLADIKKLDVVPMASCIIESVTTQSANCILSTSFGRYSAVLLKMVTDVAPDTPVVWVDSGYNTEETYQHCEQLQKLLRLNLHIYHPRRSVNHRTAIGHNPKPGDPGYDEFVNEIKLEPFRRALRELQADRWITGIRQEETEHRRSLDVLTSGPNGIVKVAPLFYWQETDLINYSVRHKLPFALNYRDLAKPNSSQECGLHCHL